jgi:hypothetical protein
MGGPWKAFQDRFRGEDVQFLPTVIIVTLAIAAASYFVTDALFR